MQELSEETISYIKNTDLLKRKKYGQYFTHKTIRDFLINNLPKIKNANILEPSCGTGEFIQTILDNFENPNIDAVEIDKKLYDICHNKYKNISITNGDTLTTSFSKKYDFIIGNPPYFEIALSESDKVKYANIISGRMNIFS